MNAEQATQKWSFEIPPEPISESMIYETVQADLIVVGEGFSGLCTALSAIEEGIDTIIITGSSHPIGRGGSVFAAHSKVMRALGYPRFDPTDFFLQEFASNSYNIDQRKWYSFYNNSETAMDWLIDMIEADGVSVVLENGNEDDQHSPSFQPVGTHSFITKEMTTAGIGIMIGLKTLEKNFLQSGGCVSYRTVAKQLVRDNDGEGRVSAVIATNPEGKYVKYEANKAVVLATGDFSANRDMMTKYCPAYAEFFDDKGANYNAGFVEKGIYRGDGHQMALWAGAAWQRTFPNAPVIQGDGINAHMPYGGHRGLYLNRDGERFMNEDCSAVYATRTILREPGRIAYSIWGRNYAYDVEWSRFGSTRGSKKLDPTKIVEGWEQHAARGAIVKGETIDEVIFGLGLPLEAARASIERYNASCRSGTDMDFYKKAKYLQEIKEAPFYGAVEDEFHYFSVLGGPRTNHNMQICDDNDKPIPGLYAAGSLIGDLFANCYNFRIAGHNYGCSLTFGYLTGKYIAKNE